MTKTTTSDILTIPEVAQFLGITTRTVHRRIARGELVPATKLPGVTGAYLFDRAVIEQIAAERKAGDAA